MLVFNAENRNKGTFLLQAELLNDEARRSAAATAAVALAGGAMVAVQVQEHVGLLLVQKVVAQR